ncbi:isochorismatase family protein [uncultured Sphingomonas sp.]|uniref:isochorismatase family protein n=1 Tax=uncultured Sphingomonas sp. TaxID=158754 RepID=UPI0025CBCABE|nr:isochorismatase family protein [uncultured Sphingomonas sp.]
MTSPAQSRDPEADDLLTPTNAALLIIDLQPVRVASIVSMERRELVANVAAVKATGRRKLIMVALWTEVCLAFPALDALREGVDVYPVVDAVGGTSLVAHAAGLARIQQAGGRPISWIQLVCEFQRDWNRWETVEGFSDIVFASIHP